jgi:hypothetical protein
LCPSERAADGLIVGDAAFGDAAVVGAVGVVDLDVFGEVSLEAAVADVEVALATFPADRDRQSLAG